MDNILENYPLCQSVLHKNAAVFRRHSREYALDLLPTIKVVVSANDESALMLLEAYLHELNGDFDDTTPKHVKASFCAL